jgi:hypothetical protein
MRVFIGVGPVNLRDPRLVALDINAGVRKELPDRGGNPTCSSEPSRTA